MPRYRATLTFPTTAGAAPFVREFVLAEAVERHEIVQRIGQAFAASNQRTPDKRLWRCDVEVLEP